MGSQLLVLISDVVPLVPMRKAVRCLHVHRSPRPTPAPAPRTSSPGRHHGVFKMDAARGEGNGG